MPGFKLVPVPQDDWKWTGTLNISDDGGFVTVGRRDEQGISPRETAISRNHAEVRATEAGNVELTAKKEVWLCRKGTNEVQSCPKGSIVQVGSLTILEPGKRHPCLAVKVQGDENLNVQLELKDAVFLCKRGNSPAFGFRLEKAASSRAKRSNSGTPTRTPSQKRQQILSPSKPATQYFAGQEIVYWERKHIHRVAIQRATEAGAMIADNIGLNTTHVVASTGMSPAAVAAKLGQEEDELQLPEGVHFVNSHFVPSCNAEGRLLPPTQFLVPLLQKPESKGAAENANSSQRDQQQADPPAADEAPAAEETAKRAPSSSITQEAVASQGKGVPVVVWDPNNVTGGDSGRPWGEGGIWVEPWDEAAAKETLEKLYKHWHRYLNRRASASSQASGTVDEDPGAASSEEEREEEAVEKGPCGHMACSVCKCCIVDQLKLLLEQYDTSGTDQWRRKPALRAILKVEKHEQVLRSEADIEALELGEKTTAKVKEIVVTGQLARNEAFLADPKAQTLALFASVWGAAKTTAERWYDGGCRTLDDVRRRTDLTDQQVAGLKHYEALKLRIPREECSAIAGVVTEAVQRLFAWPTQGSSPAHIRAMGSFVRGKPATSDVDMLLVPPETEPRPAHELMNTLLSDLHAKGFITEDVRPLKTKKTARRDESSCSFIGFCLSPDKPLVRRLDIKIYPRWSLPFAVNYFTGSGPFNRAIRYWATTAAAARAAAKNLTPASSGFKLSDTMLVPISRFGTKKERREVLAGLPVPSIKCETDIFRLLELAYVPPHMRFFHNYH